MAGYWPVWTMAVVLASAVWAEASQGNLPLTASAPLSSDRSTPAHHPVEVMTAPPTYDQRYADAQVHGVSGDVTNLLQAHADLFARCFDRHVIEQGRLKGGSWVKVELVGGAEGRLRSIRVDFLNSAYASDTGLSQCVRQTIARTGVTIPSGSVHETNLFFASRTRPFQPAAVSAPVASL